MIWRTVDSLSRRLEVALVGRVDVDEFLWVAIEQRKPTALNLNHQSVPRPESMADILERELYDRRLVRFERFGLLKTLTELAAKDVAADELLVPPKPHVTRVRVWVG